MVLSQLMAVALNPAHAQVVDVQITAMSVLVPHEPIENFLSTIMGQTTMAAVTMVGIAPI